MRHGEHTIISLCIGFNIRLCAQNPGRLVVCPGCKAPLNFGMAYGFVCTSKLSGKCLLNTLTKLKKKPETLYHYIRHPHDDPRARKPGWIPAIVHIALLIAKWSNLKCQLSISIPTIPMVIQLKFYLNMYKIDSHKAVKNRYFSEWRPFILSHFSHKKVVDLMKTFQYTER